MKTAHETTSQARAATVIRKRIEQGGDRVWRLEDFADLSAPAAAQALSRLAKAGQIERLSKGLYYRSRPTPFGKSRPNPSTLRALAARRKSIYPAGTAAASLLGFTTQSPAHPEYATSESSLPRKLIGRKAVIRTRRPEAWAQLPEEDTALLDFLRRAGATSELTPTETVRKTLKLMLQPGRFERILSVAAAEPPRVRAILGALAEEIGGHEGELRRLRSSLNPLSRFDFGILVELRYAAKWQAKKRRRHASM